MTAPTQSVPLVLKMRVHRFLGGVSGEFFLTSNRTKNARMLGFSMLWLDLVIFPFVFIGFAVDYYGKRLFWILRFHARMVGWNSFPLISDNLAIGYGLLIFLGFASLSLAGII